MRTIKIIGILVAAGFTLSACAKPGERVRFDGNYYPAKVKKSKDARENFTVTVRRAKQGLAGAREAGRYEGTDYCIKNVGDSTIAWSVGPDSDEALITEGGDTVVLRGTCNKW